jgi:hypothetical protein
LISLPIVDGREANSFEIDSGKYGIGKGYVA